MRWCLPATVLLAACLLQAPALAERARDTTPPPPGQLGEREVAIVNRGPAAISEIYVSPSTVDAWGDDRLGDAVLEPGRTTRLRLGRLHECGFDILVIYQDASREERTAQNLCRTRQVSFDGKNRIQPPGLSADPREIVLINQSLRAIQQVFISPADATQWGEDLLPRLVPVGERGAITYRGVCTVDIRIVFENRAAEERRAIDLCRHPTLSIEPGWTTSDELPAPPA